MLFTKGGYGAHAVLQRGLASWEEVGQRSSDDESEEGGGNASDEVELFSSPPSISSGRSGSGQGQGRKGLTMPSPTPRSERDEDDEDDEEDDDEDDEDDEDDDEDVSSRGGVPPSTPRRSLPSQPHRSGVGSGAGAGAGQSPLMVLQSAQRQKAAAMSPMEEYAAALRQTSSPDLNGSHTASQSHTTGERLETTPDDFDVDSPKSSIGGGGGGKGSGGKWGRLRGVWGVSQQFSAEGGEGQGQQAEQEQEDDDEDAAARAEAAALRARILAEREKAFADSTANDTATDAVSARGGHGKLPPRVPVAVAARAALHRGGGGRPPLPNAPPRGDHKHKEHAGQDGSEGEEEELFDDDQRLPLSLSAQYFQRYDTDVDNRLSVSELQLCLNCAFPDLGLDNDELEELIDEARKEVPTIEQSY